MRTRSPDSPRMHMTCAGCRHCGHVFDLVPGPTSGARVLLLLRTARCPMCTRHSQAAPAGTRPMTPAELIAGQRAQRRAAAEIAAAPPTPPRCRREQTP
jgi:hypothetical protein